VWFAPKPSWPRRTWLPEALRLILPEWSVARCRCTWPTFPTATSAPACVYSSTGRWNYFHVRSGRLRNANTRAPRRAFMNDSHIRGLTNGVAKVRLHAGPPAVVGRNG
jgi:hypothetical protein